MDIIRRKFKCLGRHHTQAMPIEVEFKHVALESSPFRKLPLELVLIIASYLPLESVGSLSLSCHTLYSRLRMECLQPLKEAEYSVINGFLYLLERDLPTHIVCPFCNKLHSITAVEHRLVEYQGWSSIREPWLRCWTGGSHFDKGIRAGFSSSVFLMVMKAHRQGHSTTELLRLLSFKTEVIARQGFVQQQRATARIQDGSLLVREQWVFVVPSTQNFPLPWCGSLNICYHMNFVSMVLLYRYGIKIPRSSEIEGYENKQGIIYCWHCYTEFRVDFKSYGEAGNAMFVTRWMDIGEARDINDIKWRSRRADTLLWTNVDFQRGSICAAFEQTPEFKFDSLLTQQDEKYLCMKSPWPWPQNAKPQYDRDSRFHKVMDGRLVPLKPRDCEVSFASDYRWQGT